jgi:alkyl hydroperoxide reductase subunit AhpC
MPSYEAGMTDFERHDAQVVGISIDSIPSHIAWAKSLGDITRYPLLADFHPKGEVSRKYGVLREDDGYSERAIFIIDKEGIVRYIDVHEIGEAPDSAQILEILGALG